MRGGYEGASCPIAGAWASNCPLVARECLEIRRHHPTKFTLEETRAFRATYEREVGASEVTVARVSPPPSSPPARLTIVALRFDEGVPSRIVTQLAEHVPLADRADVTVDGLTFVEQRRDDTFASTVVWIGAHEVVVVYGGVIADEQRVAVSVVKGLR